MAFEGAVASVYVFVINCYKNREKGVSVVRS